MEDRQEVKAGNASGPYASPKAEPNAVTSGLLRIIPLLHLVAAICLALFLTAVLAWPLLKRTPAEPILWWCFDAYCHNIPARSIYLAGEPLPVCSRCTGVIAGYLLGAVAALCGAEKTPVWRLPWAILFICLMGVSWLGGYYGILKPHWHAERVVAGALGGIGGYIFIARCVVLGAHWWQRRKQHQPAAA